MKCQAEQPVDTNQVGGEFLQQPTTSDNPAEWSTVLHALPLKWVTYRRLDIEY